MDAIECGIVKLPRVPVADNLINVMNAPIQESLGAYSHANAEKRTWKIKCVGSACHSHATANGLVGIYNGHYEKTYELWKSMIFMFRRVLL